jgi:hypothetical protein
MHRKGLAKGSENQRSIDRCTVAAPSIHRKLTMLSTAGKVYAMRKRRRPLRNPFFFAASRRAARGRAAEASAAPVSDFRLHGIGAEPIARKRETQQAMRSSVLGCT